jgi:threonine dehydratase
MGVQVRDQADRDDLINHLLRHGYGCQDLSDDELAKVHLRHMVGGRLPVKALQESGRNCSELLYRFEFPERPGALMRFVSALHPEWTISIFHYRNHGADVGRIVVGVLVPENDRDDWNHFLRDLGYPSWEETGNPAYRLFLGPRQDPG